jgi:hypothetical protein
MEQKDLGEGFQEWKAKPGADPWFGPTGDEKLHQAAACLTNRPRTERIAEDGWSSMHSSNASIMITHGTSFLGEGIHEEILELGDEGGVGQGRVFLDARDDTVSEVGIAACKLMSKGGKMFLSSLLSR